MFADEARALVERIRAGESLAVGWESQESRCSGEARFEKGLGFVLKFTEQSCDEMSPPQAREQVCSESELIELIRREEADQDAQGIRIDPRIRIGKVHRTLCALKVIVREYDAGVTSLELPPESLFQAWRPLTSNSTDIPITLGRNAPCFDWGVTSSYGHFLGGEDFFNRCEALPE